jgi:signal transduction histidine kinase
LPVQLLVVVAVLAPTATLLWFMGRALENERDAGQQRLWQAYRGQLEALQSGIETNWDARVRELEALVQGRTAPEAFAAAVRGGLAEAVIIYDEEGRPAYPGTTITPGLGIDGPLVGAEAGRWAEANRLEHREDDLEAAARAYADLAERTNDVQLEARAHQAHARCLVKSGRRPDALQLLVETLAQDRFVGTRDEQGRAIQPAARLLALELAGRASPQFDQVAEQLARELRDYTPELGGSIPSRQRRFLMRELRALAPEHELDTVTGEEVAARVLDENPSAARHQHLTPAASGVWQLSLANGRLRALFDEERLRPVIDARASDEGVRVAVFEPGREPDRAFVTLPAGKHLPGWQLALSFEDREQLETQAREKRIAYLTTGVLIAVAMMALAAFVVGAVRRQERLTRLKNDLLATVSHELKTPLSSMRLLVETLLEADRLDPARVREYLELISKENARLSRLIESFLTFSKLEREKGPIERHQHDPHPLADAAVEAAGDRLSAPNCTFALQVEPDLPTVDVDREAFVTVLLNLLENAWKYTGEEKRIEMRVYRDDAQVCFSVKDDGIGLSGKDQERIFDSFYQVDQRLARSGSGVGLGLAIVNHIVRAHNGSVSVASETGSGSTFTVRLPVSRGTSTMKTSKAAI